MNKKFGLLPIAAHRSEHEGMESADLNPITYFGETNYRNRRVEFGIRRKDRRNHFYVIGKTGTGKSSLLQMMVVQDIRRGEGIAFLDPHGDTVERVLRSVPEARKEDVIYLDVADRNSPHVFNPLEPAGLVNHARTASDLLDVFKKLWADSWGPRLEHILRNALLALVEQPGATLPDILKMLNDRAYRKTVLIRCTNRAVRDFWLKEYEEYPERFRIEAVAPIQNKVGAFVSNPILNRLLSQPRSSWNPREVMDQGKILLINLAKGKIGADTAALLGSLIVSSFASAALNRAAIPEHERRDFFLYADEFQNFTTMSFATMLSELRKYRLNLILAHQFLTQLEEPVRDAILGNVGTMVAFRVGTMDAETLAREFFPEISPEDFVNLPNFQTYLKLMIDGAVSKPFSAKTINDEKRAPGGI